MYGTAASSRLLQKAFAATVTTATQTRTLASVAPHIPVQSTGKVHKVVVIGGGTAGLSVSHQLLRTGKFSADDIAIVDPAEYHHYQPGWTLVGGGLKTKEELRRPLDSLVDPKLKLYREAVANIQPQDNTVKLSNGDALSYDHLIAAPGIKLNPNMIEGLQDALEDPTSMVSSIYSYNSCDKVYPLIQKFRSGNAIFTQPAGAIKCAGAPQKIMWLALDYWKNQDAYTPTTDPSSKSPISISFATGLPVMFGVPKYSKALDKLRQDRAVEALFEHDLVSITVKDRTATFKSPHSKEPITKPFDFLHVTPKMGPHKFIADSPLANPAGFVDVNDATLQHKKFDNVWSLGDASSLPTSKTAAAITAQAPVLVQNLLQAMDGGAQEGAEKQTYDGYTSCPLLTGEGKVMLAEFKYGPEPKETFGSAFGLDQAEPRRAFYHLKKDFFPWVYYQSMVKGTWAGPKGWKS